MGVDSDPRERRESFDKVPDIYHRIRPGYPRALFDDLFDLLPERPYVLEVGPGTGQPPRDLLARGAGVRDSHRTRASQGPKFAAPTGTRPTAPPSTANSCCPYSGTQSMEAATRQGLLDDMEAFAREHFDDQVTRPLVVTLTTATRTP